MSASSTTVSTGRKHLLDSNESNKILTIPLVSIMEELSCPVCFSTMSEATMTRCGHHFCKQCILECLNRKHQCPCCNSEALAADLLPNIHFDRLIEVVKTERALAHQKYLQSLANPAAGSPSTVSSLEGSEEGKGAAAGVRTVSPFSPIESTFMRNMQHSLTVYEDYYRSLEAKLLRSVGVVENEYAVRLTHVAEQQASSASTSLASLDELGSQVEELRVQCRREVEEMERSFQSSFALLAQAYDDFLKQSTVVPRLLPIRVDVVLEHPAVTYKAIVVKPTDSLVEIKKLIADRCEAQDMALAKFTPENQFVFRRPFIIDETTGLKSILMSDEHRPILEYLNFEAEPGCSVVMQGPLALKSETAEPCFTQQPYEKGVSKTDYFTCRTCNLNWVCRGCHITCHKSKGHDTVPYLLNNTPTWRCCYCAKKKLCPKPL